MSFVTSLNHAIHGLVWGFVFEANMRRQIAIGVVVVALGYLLDVTGEQWLVLITMGLVVVTLELINSSIEALADAVHPAYSEHIQRSKDLSAGAVLLMSGVAGMIGASIFLPRLLQLVG